MVMRWTATRALVDSLASRRCWAEHAGDCGGQWHGGWRLATGGEFELALSCDMILASHSAPFALPEIPAGILADAATITLPKRIPFHFAMESLFTDRWRDAEEARRRGVVNVVVQPTKLLQHAWELARRLETGPPLVFAPSRRSCARSGTSAPLMRSAALRSAGYWPSAGSMTGRIRWREFAGLRRSASPCGRGTRSLLTSTANLFNSFLFPELSRR